MSTEKQRIAYAENELLLLRGALGAAENDIGKDNLDPYADLPGYGVAIGDGYWLEEILTEYIALKNKASSADAARTHIPSSITVGGKTVTGSQRFVEHMYDRWMEEVRSPSDTLVSENRDAADKAPTRKGRKLVPHQERTRRAARVFEVLNKALPVPNTDLKEVTFSVLQEKSRLTSAEVAYGVNILQRLGCVRRGNIQGTWEIVKEFDPSMVVQFVMPPPSASERLAH